MAYVEEVPCGACKDERIKGCHLCGGSGVSETIVHEYVSENAQVCGNCEGSGCHMCGGSGFVSYD